MKLSVIKERLNFKLLTDTDLSNIDIKTGLVGDLLSYILSKGSEDTIWLTIQRHINIIAVASSVEIPVIVICDNIIPEQKVIDAAADNEIILLAAEFDAFTASGLVHSLLNEKV